ncbi:hypothetical protein FB446DRAFT_850023 [Lentinula raphanica]|nr:hypothetical protein FB446DRAFT_850023 [Lentinula raphanica]
MTRPTFILPTLGIIFVFLTSTVAPEVFAAPIFVSNELGHSGDNDFQAGSDASHYPAPTSPSSSLAGAGPSGTDSAIQEKQLTGPTGDAPKSQSWHSATSTAVHGFETEDSRVEGLLIPRAAASTDTDESSSSSLTLKTKKKKKGKGKAVDYEDLRDNEYRGRYSKQKGNGKAQFHYPSSRMRQFESESSSSSSESHTGRYSKQKGNGKARVYYPSSRMRQFESESSSSSSEYSSSSSESHTGRYSKQKGNGEAQFYYPSSRMRQFESESSDYSSISGSSGSANFGSSGSSSESGSSSGSSSESGPSTARGHRSRPPTVRHTEAAPSHSAPSPSHNTQQTIFDELEATLQGYEAELDQMIAQSVTFGVFRAFVTRVDDLATDISHQASASPAHRSDAQWPALIDRVQKLSFECKEAAKRAGMEYNRGLGREDAVHAIASGQISYDELHHDYRPVYAPPTQEAGPSHQGQGASAWHAPGSSSHTQQDGGGYPYYGTWPVHGYEAHGHGEHGYDEYGYEYGYEGHGHEGHGYEEHRYEEHGHGENGNENHGNTYEGNTYGGNTYGGHGYATWPENGQYGH